MREKKAEKSFKKGGLEFLLETQHKGELHLDLEILDLRESLSESRPVPCPGECLPITRRASSCVVTKGW